MGGNGCGGRRDQVSQEVKATGIEPLESSFGSFFSFCFLWKYSGNMLIHVETWEILTPALSDRPSSSPLWVATTLKSQ